MVIVDVDHTRFRFEESSTTSPQKWFPAVSSAAVEIRRAKSNNDVIHMRCSRKREIKEHKETKSENIQGQCHGNAKCGERRWRDELDAVIVIQTRCFAEMGAGWVW